MEHELVSGQVYCHIFDKTFQNSEGLYNKLKNHDGVKSLRVQQNISNIKQELGVDDVFMMRQVHGSDVFMLNESNLNEVVRADAVVSCMPNIALSILTADCVPVLFSSDCGSIIGAAHCGWRSARKGVVQNVFDVMRSVSNQNIRAFIGPAIQQNSYEVDQKFYDDFLSESLKNKKFFINSTQKNLHYMFDLVAYVQYKIEQCAIEISDICRDDTYSMSNKYPSFRRFTHQNKEYNSNILSTIRIKR